MKKITAIVLVVLVCCTSNSFGQYADTDNYGTIKALSPESYAETIERLGSHTPKEAFDRWVGEFIDVEPVSTRGMSKSELDALYSKRLKMMATEVQLPYNPIVRSYIERYSRKGGTMEAVLGLGRYYFPIFEQILFEHGLPLELKMLPVIESALVPVAKSHASAVGLWQMMMPTAKYYGLEINSFVDERQDPILASHAACNFLKDLYTIYKDWTLVIAAYNCGQGNVNKAMRNAGAVGSYWDIWEHLPRETRGYVPAFIAASYSYTFHKAHGLEPREIRHQVTVDTLMISRMLHFEQITSTIAVSMDEIRALNPMYRLDIVPAIDRQYPLVLPVSSIDDFIVHRDEILSKDSTYLRKYLEVDNFSIRKVESLAKGGYQSGVRLTHKVASGETLGGIALKYNVSITDIQKWNNITGTNIRVGQQLSIIPK